MFRKAPFSRRIRVNSRPNRRNKAAFSNSSGEVRRLQKLEQEQATLSCLTYRHKFLICKWFNVWVQKLATKKCEKKNNCQMMSKKSNRCSAKPVFRTKTFETYSGCCPDYWYRRKSPLHKIMVHKVWQSRRVGM